MSPEAEAVGLAQSWNSLSDPAVPMVKGRAGPRSNSSLTDTPACRRTSAGSIATLVCSGLRAGRGPGTVGAGALILLAPPLAHWRTTPPSLYFRVVPLKKGLDILYSMLGLFWHACSSLTTKFGPCFSWGPKTALNDLFHSNSAVPEFIELLSVDSPVESYRHRM